MGCCDNHQLNYFDDSRYVSMGCHGSHSCEEWVRVVLIAQKKV
jgi:hypothetical protein